MVTAFCSFYFWLFSMREEREIKLTKSSLHGAPVHTNSLIQSGLFMHSHMMCRERAHASVVLLGSPLMP